MDNAEIARRKEVRRSKLKIAAKLRAEINFRHALERVDHRIDEVEPAQAEVEKALQKGKTLELEA